MLAVKEDVLCYCYNPSAYIGSQERRPYIANGDLERIQGRFQRNDPQCNQSYNIDWEKKARGCGGQQIYTRVSPSGIGPSRHGMSVPKNPPGLMYEICRKTKAHTYMQREGARLVRVLHGMGVLQYTR